MASVFERIYRDKVWGEGSGPGSDPVAAKPYLDYLRKLIAEKQIKHVVDVGCGDRRIYDGFTGFNEVWYMGVDIVPAFQDFTKCSEIYDHHKDHVDLYIIKDVLQHLPHAENLRILKKAMEAKWVLVTNDRPQPGEYTGDTWVGGYRKLNMMHNPYNLLPYDSLIWDAKPFSKLTQLLESRLQPANMR